MWHNGEQKIVLNTSDSDGGKNSFPSIGNVGTTYAGGNNPKNKLTGQDDYLSTTSKYCRLCRLCA